MGNIPPYRARVVAPVTAAVAAVALVSVLSNAQPNNGQMRAPAPPPPPTGAALKAPAPPPPPPQLRPVTVAPALNATFANKKKYDASKLQNLVRVDAGGVLLKRGGHSDVVRERAAREADERLSDGDARVLDPQRRQRAAAPRRQRRAARVVHPQWARCRLRNPRRRHGLVYDAVLDKGASSTSRWTDRANRSARWTRTPSCWSATTTRTNISSFKNSWGKDTGHDGYLYISYDYAQTYAMYAFAVID